MIKNTDNTRKFGFSLLLMIIWISFNIPTCASNTSGIAINADYCLGLGNVKLTAPSGYSSYLWSNGSASSSIIVHQAGIYSLSVTDAFGIAASGSITVGDELITNGDFSSGNSGFTSNYTYNANSIIDEGVYTLTPDVSIQHYLFQKGYDHTNPGTGLFMAINGNTTKNITVWQQTITVQPNTTYYFSSWAKGISSYADPTDRQAILQFSINGETLGTPFQVTPFVWKQFYTSWNSGSNTTATIKLIDTQTAIGGNDFGIDDLSFTTLSPVSLSCIASTTSPACEGSTATLNASITGGYCPLSFSWNSSTGFSSTSQNPTITNITSSNSGTYNVTVTDSKGCQTTNSTSLTVNSIPQGTLNNDGPICPKASAHLQYTATSGVGPFDLIINGSTYSNVKSGDLITVTPGTTTSYSLSSITDKGIVSSCPNTSPISTTVTVLNDDTWNMPVAGNLMFCSGGSTVLTASEAVSYVWNTGATTPSLTINQPGIYTITGVNGSGCTKKMDINISEIALPEVNLNISPDYLTTKEKTINYSTSSIPNCSYLWNFGDGITDASVTGTHVYTLSENQQFFDISLKITDQYGCSNQKIKKLWTAPLIPNVFTPNGDNYNDYFMPHTDIQIFDRNGILIYKGNTDSSGWDGTYKGQKADPDTYFYILHYFNNNDEQIKKGFVTLVR